MAKKAVSTATADPTTKPCPHCGKSCHCPHGPVTNDDGSPGSMYYNSKIHVAGHFCEHCDKPLDMVALNNTNLNYGDETSRKNLFNDLKVKVLAFQNG